MSKAADKILTTAEYLFNQHSFSSVGVDLIRDASGSSKTTMYTHFKNKQQLIAEVLTQRDLRFKTSLDEYIGTATGVAALEKILQWHLDWFQQDHFKGCLFVRVVAETTTEQTELQHIAQQHKQWIYQRIQQTCQSLQNSEQVTLLFYTQLEGLISRFLVEGYNVIAAQKQQQLIMSMIELLQHHKMEEV